MQADAKSALMRECLAIHFEHARAKRRRMVIMMLVLSLGAALLLGVIGGNPFIFGFCAVLFLALTSPLPLVVQYTDFVRIRGFERRFAASPSIVRSVLDFKARINGTYTRRAVIRTTSNEDFGIMLPPERIAQLTEAFPPQEDFETAMAEALRLSK